MPAPLLLDLSHTSHTRARTGIQRVARSLQVALGGNAMPVTHDPYLGGWRGLQDWEIANLRATTPAGKRGARWPLVARLRGRFGRWRLGSRAAVSPAIEAASPAGLVVPELFSPAVANALPALFAATRGPRIALFHDAIALTLPELTPPKTVARFPAYLMELLRFDGIAAVSDDSRQTLLAYWDWLGIKDRPQVTTIPLGVDFGRGRTESRAAATQVPTILCVGSIEGRKNHLALFEACARLWDEGVHFELHVVGMARAETAQAAIQKMESLRSSGRPLRYDGAADDAALERAYAEAAFTVYPSVLEGFGLPVLESLAHGTPCVCSAGGALGESARGGGCVTLEDVGTDTLAPAIKRLLADPAELRRLGDEARQRNFRTWSDYVTDLTAWIQRLRENEEWPERGGLRSM